MISISSAFPVLPAQDSLYYELLALTAICGEVPCACADRLTSSKSYRKKVVTSLTHGKLLRIFSKDHLRGYRLGIRGKRLLRERAPERFQFYLSGRTDTNSIKSSPARRLRLHRIAQAYVTMLNAGAAIYRDEKPPVFVPGGSSPCRIESTAFYDSREMKELGLEMIKVHGSRMVGSLMTPSHTFAVFNGSVAVSSTSKALSTLRVSDYTPQYRESSGVGKRPVLTPDEVLRLPVDEALVILRGHKVLKVHKMDYSLHPAYKQLRECKASAHIPEWRKVLPETLEAPPAETAKASPKVPPRRRGRPAKSKAVVATDKESIITKPENEKEIPHGNEQ